MIRTIQGYVDVTVRVPFSAIDDVEDGDPFTAEDWMDAYNDGSMPDALEAATMPHADTHVHEVVANEISEAWYVTAEHDHDTRCCTDHAVHVSPHRGCILR